jgi:tetratricopeptide (TPR) repeat protein
MKKWAITGLVVVILAALVASVSWWLPPVLRFVGANTDLIQGLESLVQLVLVAATFLTALVSLWRTQKPRASQEQTATTPAGPTTLETTALHQLPPPPGDFTGRTAELNELMAALEQGGVTISGLRGLGGVGKTALALKLAEELTPRYPDAQFYLDLKGTSPTPLSAADAMAHVIRACHPTARLPDSEAELRGLYQSVLHSQRALLLMDNAANARQVAALIPPASCVLLVTSRQHFTLPGLYPLNLDILPPADAHLNDTERDASQRGHAVHYWTVAATANELYLKGGGWVKHGLGLFDIEWKNIQAGQAWAEAYASEDDTAARLCSDYPNVGVHLLDLRQHPREHIRWLEAALVAARRLRNRIHEEVHLGNLSLAYADLGETRRAIEYHEQYLAIAREIGDHRGEGNALWNMSLALDKLGDRARAIAHAEATLKIFEQIEDPNAAKVRRQLARWRR